MYKCPVCHQMLSIEMAPVGKDRRGNTMPKFVAALEQTTRWAIETAIRAYLEHGRSLYFTCNNSRCPACWKLSKQIYFSPTPVGTVVLVDDFLGLRLNLYKAQYRKRQNQKK